MMQVIRGSIYGIVFIALGLAVLFGPFDGSKKKEAKGRSNAKEKILGIIFILCGVIALAATIWYVS